MEDIYKKGIKRKHLTASSMRRILRKDRKLNWDEEKISNFTKQNRRRALAWMHEYQISFSKAVLDLAYAEDEINDEILED